MLSSLRSCHHPPTLFISFFAPLVPRFFLLSRLIFYLSFFLSFFFTLFIFFHFSFVIFYSPCSLSFFSKHNSTPTSSTFLSTFLIPQCRPSFSFASFFPPFFFFHLFFLSCSFGRFAIPINLSLSVVCSSDGNDILTMDSDRKWLIESINKRASSEGLSSMRRESRQICCY